MNSNDFTYKKVNPEDTFQFHCKRCGECCHNVKDAIMLTTLDLFQLARQLNRPVEDVVLEYTEPVTVSDNSFPLFVLKTKQHNDACFLYKNSCSVQGAGKPLPCRLYPLNIEPGPHDGLSYLIVSQKPHHYTGATHSVADWMKENLTPDDRRFMVGWFEQVLELGRLMRGITQKSADGKMPEQLMIKLVLLMYFSYDIEKNFWPQYEWNMGLLKKLLETSANGDLR